MTLSHHCTYINTKFSCTNVCSIRKQILFEVPRYANAAPIRGVDFNWRITNFHLTAPVRGVPLYIIFCLSWWHHSRIPYLFFPTCYNHSGQGWGRLLWNDYGCNHDCDMIFLNEQRNTIFFNDFKFLWGLEQVFLSKTDEIQKSISSFLDKFSLRKEVFSRWCFEHAAS